MGLLQLLPGTASDLAGETVSPEQLQQAERNARLGARYLRQLLNRWQGDPLLAIASYNAGPAAVKPWISAQLREIPELWVEAIPYPETRLYVKKVLGNLWSLQAPDATTCATGTARPSAHGQVMISTATAICNAS